MPVTPASRDHRQTESHIKELTSRSNGMGYVQCKEALKLFISGWVEYYKLARMKKTESQWVFPH